MSNSPEEIRQKAYALLERVGGPDKDEDPETWPEEPSLPPSTLREESKPLNSYHDTPQKAQMLRQEQEEEEMFTDNENQGNNSGVILGVVGFFCQCVSDACESSSNMLSSQSINGYYQNVSVPSVLGKTGYGSIQKGEPSTLPPNTVYRDDDANQQHQQQQSRSETSLES